VIYLGKFVLRRWRIARDLLGNSVPVADSEALVVDTLEEAREHVPAECVNIGRTALDDPVIKEVWI
jgi:hypothetical protein